jgi:RNA polymerase sigma factor (sigma-70 family)
MTTATLERSDDELVAAVRSGDERAFEALYERYQRRIHGFVARMVSDHGRAEDVTQEVFVSALRRMQATDRPIAFKPWIYEIAKNACIDAFRRSRRTEEVSYDAAAGLRPSDHRRLVGADPPPDVAVAAKQELETLCGAFGGLSDAQHEILVMRELEGRSYNEIGDRLGMSPAGVESTLFRARRRLSEEYDELISGERCRRVHRIIAVAAEGGRLGVRDSRRLARHVAHCQPCRREALAAGLDRDLIARPPLHRRAAAKVGSWLPVPALLRSRRGGGTGIAGQLPAVSDQLSAGWGKLATAAAVLVAGVGAGAEVQHHAGRAHAAQGAPRPAVAAAARGSARSASPAQRLSGAGRASASPATGRKVATGASSSRPAASGGGSAPTRASSSAAPSGAGARSPAAPGSGGGKSAANAARPVTNTVQRATGAVPAVGGAVHTAANRAGNAVSGVGGAAGNAVSGVAGAAGNAVSGVGGGAGEAVSGVGGAAGNAVSGVGGAAGNAVSGVGGAAGNAIRGAGGAAGNGVGGAASGAAGAVGGAVGGAGQAAGGAVGGAGKGAGGAVSGAGNAVGGAVSGAGTPVRGATGAAGGAVGGATGAVGAAAGSLPGVG